MSLIEKMTVKRFFSALSQPIGVVLSAALLLLLPESSFADIENLYAEGYSSSVGITNPSNAYGRRDGNTADSDKEHWGDDVENGTFTMPIHKKMSLGGLTRVGLSPLVGAGVVLGRVNLGKRWPLLITMAVIISVLIYMDILVRRYRDLATKPAHRPKGLGSSGTLRPGAKEVSRNGAESLEKPFRRGR
jgi:hypothetical protein